MIIEALRMDVVPSNYTLSNNTNVGSLVPGGPWEVPRGSPGLSSKVPTLSPGYPGNSWGPRGLQKEACRVPKYPHGAPWDTGIQGKSAMSISTPWNRSEKVCDSSVGT